MTCCICEEEIEVEPLSGWSEGHNADPVVPEGRCCNNCNADVVVPERMRRVMQGKPQRTHL